MSFATPVQAVFDLPATVVSKGPLTPTVTSQIGGLSALGDLNGDGMYNEFVAGSYYYNRAEMFFLDPLSGSMQVFSELSDGVGGLPIGTLAAGDYFGSSTAFIGDIGSGPMLAVGAYGDDTGVDLAGAVHMMTLAPNGTASSYLGKITNGQNGMPGGTLGFHYGLGRWVEYLGVFGPGPMLAAGTPYDDEGAFDAGTLLLLHITPDGHAAIFTRIGNGLHGFATNAILSEAYFGASVALLGPTADGGLMLGVGASNDPTGSAAAGAVYTITVNATGYANVLQKACDGQGGIPAGTLDPSDMLGRTAVGLPDAATRMMAIGASGDDTLQPGSGAVYLFSISDAGTTIDIAQLANGNNGLGSSQWSFGTQMGLTGGGGGIVSPDGTPGTELLIYNCFKGRFAIRFDAPPLKAVAVRPTTGLTALPQRLHASGGDTFEFAANLTMWGYFPTKVWTLGDGLASCSLQLPNIVRCTTAGSFDTALESTVAGSITSAKVLTGLDWAVQGNYTTTKVNLVSPRLGAVGAPGNVARTAGDGFGSALARIGDADADACNRDYAIGASGRDEDGSRTGTGAILLVAEACPEVEMGSPPRLLMEVDGSQLGPALLPNSAGLGSSVAWLSTADTQVGRRTVLAAGTPGADAVLVLGVEVPRGSAAAQLVHTARLGSSELGASAGDSLGAALAVHRTLGALDEASLFVGAPGRGGGEGGVVGLVVSPENGSMLQPPAWVDSTALSLGLGADDMFGASLAVVEPDEAAWCLAVGAPGFDSGGSDTGAVFLFRLKLGNASLSVLSWSRLANNEAFSGGSLVSLHGFGAALAWMGDLDGDGRRQELVVGGANPARRPRIWVLWLEWEAANSSAVQLPSWKMLPNGVGGMPSTMESGSDIAVAAAGDWDGDGVASDLLLGLPGSALGLGEVVRLEMNAPWQSPEPPPWGAAAPALTGATPHAGLLHDRPTALAVSGTALYDWDPLLRELSWLQNPPRVVGAGTWPGSCLGVTVAGDGTGANCSLRATLFEHRQFRLVPSTNVSLAFDLGFEPFELAIASVDEVGIIPQAGGVARTFRGTGLLPGAVWNAEEVAAAGAELWIGSEDMVCASSNLQLSVDGTSITCTSMPVGSGGPFLVYLHAPRGDRWVGNTTAMVRYEPTTVSSVTPDDHPFDRHAHYNLTVRGEGFGASPLGVRAIVGGNPCPTVEWVSSTQVECNGVPGNFSDHHVEVSVAGSGSTGGEWLLGFTDPMPAAGLVWLRGQSAVVSEAPSSASERRERLLVFRLASQPTHPVAVAFVDTAHPDQVSPVPASVTIKPADWYKPRNVTLRAVADGPDATLQTLTVVRTTVASDDASFRAIGRYGEADISVLVIDDAEEPIDATPAPELVDVALLETAQAIALHLSAPSDLSAAVGTLGATFDCAAAGLFDLATERLLSGVPDAGPGAGILPCRWETESQLIVDLPPWASPAAGSVVTLRGGSGGIRALGHPESVLTTADALPLRGRLPIPEPFSATFESSVAASLLVTFSADTASQVGNGGPSAGPCSAALANTNLGTGAWCAFVAPTAMRVYLGAGATITPRSTVSDVDVCTEASGLLVNADAIRPAEDSVNAAAAVCLHLGMGPGSLTPPTAVLHAPSPLSLCDNLTLDATESSGGAGRALAYSWEFEPLNAAGNASRHDIAAALNDQAGRDRIVLPPGLLPAGAVVRFQVAVTNFLTDTPGVAEAVVATTVSPVPQAVITGPSPRVLRRSDPLVRIEAVGTPSECANSEQDRQLGYSWELVTALTQQNVSNGYSVSPLAGGALQSQRTSGNNRVLYLDPGLLQVGGEYRLAATVTTAAGASALALVTVRVLASDLVPRVAGGASRRLSVTAPVAMDGSGSEDLDYDSQNAMMAAAGYPALQYLWTCRQAGVRGQSQPCLLSDGVTALPQQRTARFALPAGALPVGTYSFELRLSRGRSSEPFLPLALRQATTAVAVVVFPAELPALRIEASGLTTAGEVQPNTRVELQGTVSAVALPVRLRWSLVGQPSAVQGRAFATSPTQAAVAINGHLLPSGGRHTFRLTAVDSNNATAWAETTVTTNQRPVAGSLSAAPLEGAVLATEFVLSALDWADANAPLAYQFGYYRAQPAVVAAGQAEFHALSPDFAVSRPRITTLLPVGASSFNSSLTVAVRVRDAFGAVSESMVRADGSPVVVRVSAPGFASNGDMIAAAVGAWAGADELDPAGLLSGQGRLVGAVTSIVESTDLCRSVVCGHSRECVAGACYDTSTSDSGDGSEPLRPCPGSSVSSAMGVPVVECSGHGSCLRVPSRCTLQDPTGCLAFCRCHTGWAGRACGLTSGQAGTLASLYTDMLATQVASLVWLDPTAETVTQRSQALRSIATTARQLPQQAVGLGVRVAGSLASAVNATNRWSTTFAMTDVGARALLSSLSACSHALNVELVAGDSPATDAELALAAESSEAMFAAASATLSALLVPAVAEEPALAGDFLGGAYSARVVVAGGPASTGLTSGVQVALPAAAVAGPLANHIRAFAWDHNPFTWRDGIVGSGGDQNSTRQPAVAKVTVVDVADLSGREVPVASLKQPIVTTNALPAGTAPSDVECVAWSVGDADWSTGGLVALGVASDGGLRCGSTHLTALGAQLRKSQPQFNAVHPVRNASDLRYLVSPTNAAVLIVVSGLCAGFLLAWLVSIAVTHSQRERLAELRQAHFLRYGAIKPGGLEGEFLHIKRRYPSWEHPTVHQLREARRSGVTFLIIRYLWSEFWHAVRSRHTWASIFSPPLDEQLVVSRGQRVGILAGACLCSMAVSAVFFGNDPRTLATYLWVALYGSIAMMPVYYLSPFLFHQANSLTSRTHAIAFQLRGKRTPLTRRRRRQLMKDVREARRRRRVIVQGRQHRADQWIAEHILSQSDWFERGDAIVELHFPAPAQQEANSKQRQHQRQHQRRQNDSTGSGDGARSAAQDRASPPVHGRRKRAEVTSGSQASSQAPLGSPSFRRAEGGAVVPASPAASTRASLTNRLGQSTAGLSGRVISVEGVPTTHRGAGFGSPSVQAAYEPSRGRRGLPEPAAAAVTDTALAWRDDDMVLESFWTPGRLRGDGYQPDASPRHPRGGRRSSQPVTMKERMAWYADEGGELDLASPALPPPRRRAERRSRRQLLTVSSSTRYAGPAPDATLHGLGVMVRERWGLYKRAQEIRSRRGMVLAAILNVGMGWAGAVSVVFALYTILSQQYQPDQFGAAAWGTAALMGGGGVALALIGGLGVAAGQHHRVVQAGLAILAGLGLEAGGAVLMWQLQMPLASTAGALLVVVQILPMLLAIAVYLLLTSIQVRLATDVHRVAHVPELVTALLAEDKDHLVARLQAAARGFEVRSQRARAAELDAWQSMKCLRTLLIFMTYLALAAVIGLAVYFNLLYGVRFTPPQQRAWLLSSISSFLFSILVTEPLSWLGYVLVMFFWKLRSASANEIVVASLAARLAGRSQGTAGNPSGYVEQAKRLQVADLIVPPARLPPEPVLARA